MGYPSGFNCNHTDVMADAVDKQSAVSLKFRDPSTYLTKHHFLQNVVPDENFSNMRGGGPLHKDMMLGEVIANVMGNYRIYADDVSFRSSPFHSTATK